MNKYVFDLYSILNYSENIITILTKFYNEYINNTFDKNNIVDFTFNL